VNFSRHIYKANFHWPSRPQKSKAPVSGQLLQIIFVLLNSCVPCGRESLTWFNSNQCSTAKASEAATSGAPEFEYEQCMQANPTEGFQGGDDAGIETTHAHSSCIFACTHPCMRAHVHARIPARTHIHARKPVCTDAHANTCACVCVKVHAHVYTHVHACTRTHTRMHVRTSARTQMHTHMHAHAYIHACKYTRTHYTHACMYIFSHTHTHIHKHKHTCIHKLGNLMG